MVWCRLMLLVVLFKGFAAHDDFFLLNLVQVCNVTINWAINTQALYPFVTSQNIESIIKQIFLSYYNTFDRSPSPTLFFHVNIHVWYCMQAKILLHLNIAQLLEYNNKNSRYYWIASQLSMHCIDILIWHHFSFCLWHCRHQLVALWFWCSIKLLIVITITLCFSMDINIQINCIIISNTNINCISKLINFIWCTSCRSIPPNGTIFSITHWFTQITCIHCITMTMIIIGQRWIYPICLAFIFTSIFWHLQQWSSIASFRLILLFFLVACLLWSLLLFPLPAVDVAARFICITNISNNIIYSSIKSTIEKSLYSQLFHMNHVKWFDLHCWSNIWMNDIL